MPNKNDGSTSKGGRRLHRLPIDFDEATITSLDQLKESLGATSRAEVVRSSLKLMGALQEQAREGYTRIFLKNPDGEEREVIFPLVTVARN